MPKMMIKTRTELSRDELSDCKYKLQQLSVNIYCVVDILAFIIYLNRFIVYE